MFYGLTLILCAALLYLSVMDWKHFRLPDKVTFPLISMGIAQAFFYSETLRDSLIGSALGYGFFVALEIGFKAARGKPGLGRGDAKLLAAGGAWCGWMGLPYIILIASGLGLLAALTPSVRKKSGAGQIPFGPFLALGIFFVWLAQSGGFA